MTQFSKERVASHLQHLQKQVRFLERYRSLTLDEFRNNEEKTYAAFHAFQIAIQNIMDICGHIAVSVFREPYDEYKQLIPFLGTKGVLPKDYIKRASGIAEFRNKLVHGYLSVEPEKVHGYLTEELPLLSEFAKHIIEFMDKQKTETLSHG